MFGAPVSVTPSRCMFSWNDCSTSVRFALSGPVTKRQRVGSGWKRFAYAASRGGVSYAGSIEIETSLIFAPASNVCSWIDDIFIDVVGQMLSQRVKMNDTIVMW